MKTRAKVGDENADKIDKAPSIAEDIGYGETVEKGKNLFDTLYGVYLDRWYAVQIYNLQLLLICRLHCSIFGD